MGWEIIAATAVSAMSSAYQSNEQESVAKDAERKKLEAQRVEQNRINQIAADTKPTQESVGDGVEFGSSDYDTMGSYNDFITPLDTGGSLGSSGRSGLGFQI